MDEDIDSRVIEVPYGSLSPEALHGVLEEYASRGGYECGLPMENRIEALVKKLKSGELHMFFDPVEGSVNLSSHSMEEAGSGDACHGTGSENADGCDDSDCRQEN